MTSSVSNNYFFWIELASKKILLDSLVPKPQRCQKLEAKSVRKKTNKQTMACSRFALLNESELSFKCIIKQLLDSAFA
jgi:hypothetical protein